MNARAEIFEGTEVSTGPRKPSEIVAEYDAKFKAISDAMSVFERAQKDFLMAASLRGAASSAKVDVGQVSQRCAEMALLQSAWFYIWQLYKLDQFASADKKNKMTRLFEDPPAFTLENIREHIGDLVADPRGHILKGLAEAFSRLDPAFKSHEKMKIGVKGLPKRVIITHVAGYSGNGRNQLKNIFDALAVYQNRPLISFQEIELLLRDGNALKDDKPAQVVTRMVGRREVEETVPAIVGRDMWIKRYANGNAHLYFGPTALRDVNRALAEYYGEVLPDCPEERPAKAASTAVAKDLSFYRSPDKVVHALTDRLWNAKRVLDPSCGDGAILEGLRAQKIDCFGIEVDPGRAAQCREKGFKVQVANFLDVAPSPDFDTVVMNPPFYGRHYEKHVRHALKFIKPGGTLMSVLPATARYDHGLLDDLNGQWCDLPVGSFAESGTNINTVILTVRVPK
jgi:hypothetical protein